MPARMGAPDLAASRAAAGAAGGDCGAAGERGLTLPPLATSQALAGRGIRGEVEGRGLSRPRAVHAEPPRSRLGRELASVMGT